MQHIMEQFILARHSMFGANSEQSAGQGRLFDEAEVLAADSAASQDVAPLAAHQGPWQGGQQAGTG